MERVISLLGVIRGPGRVEVTSVMRVDAEPAIRGGRRTNLSAQLLGPDGRVMAESAVLALRAQACGACGCQDEAGNSYPMTFQALLADTEDGAALRVVEGEKTLWNRPAAKSRPRITGFDAKVRRRRPSSRSRAAEGLFVEASWQVRCAADTQPEAVIQWSADRGKTWYALGSLLRGESAMLDAGSLPPGRVDVRLLVSDGFYTVRAKPVSLNIPTQPPAVTIMSPRPGGTVIAGETMRVWGALTIPGREEIEDSDIRATWFIDDKAVAETIDAFVTAPRAGKHRARLAVVVGRQRATAELSFQSVRVPSENELEGKEG